MDITKQVRIDLEILIKQCLSDWQCHMQDKCPDRVADDDCDCGCDSNTLTIGLDENGDSWSYQTGDNSFTGGAYCFPHWAVVWFNSDTTIEELIKELLDEIEQIDLGVMQ